MCRYSMANYKPHYACFNCRKTFKRRLLRDIRKGTQKDENASLARCPECGNLMANMGLDFKSPKKTDVKAWKHMCTLYEVGITFHSCGCNGPGYIPNDSKALVNYFEEIKKQYLAHQHFWAQRQEDPDEQSEIAKDQNQNWSFLSRIPKELKTGSPNKPEYDSQKAQIYWNKKVKLIEENLRKLRRK